MRTRHVLTVLLLALAVVNRVGADALDAEEIASITGLEPEVKDGVVRVSVPRDDLGVVADGVTMQPFQGLTSWAAFQRAGDATTVMGDLTLAQDEVNPTMSAALDGGLEVTALHNHFFFERPRVFFMHIGGTGTTAQLATGVRKALDAARSVRAGAKVPTEGFGGPAIPAASTIDPKPLEAILGASGQTKNGMVKFVLGQTTAMHGTELGAAMGVNTWAAFAGSPETAVVDGDFAMLEDELQGVLKALRGAAVDVVAIHSHMTHEQPRIVFLHFWGKGAAVELARGLRKALDTQRK